MTQRHFRIAKIISAIVVGIAAGNAVVTNNYLFLAVAVGVVGIALLYLRSTVKGVTADERDYTDAGIAARWAIQIYSWFAVLLMLVLFSQRELNPSFEPIAVTLAYSTCILMLMYAMFFRYHQRMKFMAKNRIYLAILSLAVLILLLFGLRILSGEDGWMCQNGKWVEHGHPDFPAPQTECK